MNKQYFCEVIRFDNRIITFQLVYAESLKKVVSMLKKTYTDIECLIVKDIDSGKRYHYSVDLSEVLCLN